MKVRFYNFSKRNNSTKTPGNTDSYTELECHLKDSTSVLSPVLEIQTTVAAAFNYAYIPSWNRYYFVSDASSYEGMWYVSHKIDVLATYKTAIGLTAANVLYATGSTKNIVDSRIPVTADLLRGHNQQALSGLTINTAGMGAVIIGVTGNGSFGTYLLQYSDDIKDLLDGADDYWTNLNISNTWDAMKQAWFGGSAADCLKSAISIPLVIGGADVSSGTAEQIYLGGYPCKRSGGTNINGYRITKPVVTSTTQVSIPWQSTDWKKVSQYSDITLYIPMIGFVSVPASEAQGDSALDVKLCINVTSGDISAMVKGTQSGKFYGLASGNCAMNTAYGSTGIDTNKAMQGTMAGVGAIAAVVGGVMTGGLSTAAQLAIGASIAAGAKASIDALGGTGYGSPGMGGGASHCIDTVIHIWVTQKHLTDSQTNFNPIMGKPYMGVATIGTFSGYVQTDGFKFANVQAYSTEIEMVNDLLNTGIYYE